MVKGQDSTEAKAKAEVKRKIRMGRAYENGKGIAAIYITVMQNYRSTSAYGSPWSRFVATKNILHAKD